MYGGGGPGRRNPVPLRPELLTIGITYSHSAQRTLTVITKGAVLSLPRSVAVDVFSCCVRCDYGMGIGHGVSVTFAVMGARDSLVPRRHEYPRTL